jgi:glycosyltransferase involved in cell wall biosynthesis
MVGKDFAYFGGPNFLKGFHTLFAAAWQLKNRLHSKARIQVSDFSDISAEFSERLRSQEFILHGRLSGSAYDDVYAQIRSVIMPSINPEVLPYVTMEALLRKRLLIASNVGGVPEIVENCPGVFTFPPGDSNQLAKTMEHVWSLSSDVVADLSARNRENFIKRFDNQKTKSDFIQLLKRVQHKYT